MKKFNPLKDRVDLTTQLRFPTLSWSSLSAFRDYDKEEWYQRYVLGVKGEINPAMQAGIEIGERWAMDPTFLPNVERPEVFEYDFEGKKVKFNGINLVGHVDGLSLIKKKKLQELKTAQSDKKWTKETVRKWGQIDFYCLLLWLTKKIKPEDLEIELIYVPVVMNGDFKVEQCGEAVVIPTVRTTHDVLLFGVEIQKIYKEMLGFVAQKSII